MTTILSNFWSRFKALILVTYILHVVLRWFHGYRNSYIHVVLYKFRKSNLSTFSSYDIRSAKASVKVANSKSLEIYLNVPHLSGHFCMLVGAVWFGEKMNINIKFNFIKLGHLFENSIFTHSQKYGYRDIKQLLYCQLWESYARVAIPSEYGYKIISKLAIKEEFSSQVDEWIDSNLQGDWVGVHYRGTDRQPIKMEPYISYLKEVLDDRCNIFACSDRAQFIEQIKEVFPGRVFSREIIRSYDSEPIHIGTGRGGSQQMKDALMDILILSKAKLIYTTGSWFVEIARFFNPSVKITSLLVRGYHKKIDNFLPAPEAYQKKL